MQDLPLRDIHLPEALSWWPPAAGWWLLALLALALCAYGFFRWRRLRLRRRGLAALARIERRYASDGDERALVHGVSTLLRRICLTYWPRERVASVTGGKWRAALAALVDGRGVFSDAVFEQLVRAPYDPTMPVAPDTLLRETRRWMRALPPFARAA